jgi:hypothetical protein
VKVPFLHWLWSTEPGTSPFLEAETVHAQVKVLIHREGVIDKTKI